jgi:hypothetical protein
LVWKQKVPALKYVPVVASGNNWTLTGLSFPVGQNIFIRARGYSRGAFANGSSSIHESVRNAFLTLQPRLNIQLITFTNADGANPYAGLVLFGNYDFTAISA